ncbi:MAG: filamentous hemagglutinin N-terminal domain-containing protein [Chlamydiota bacterium]
MRKKNRCWISLFLLVSAPQLYANPEGFQIIAGEAEVSHLNEQLLSIKTGDRAVIHWDNFSIGNQETTRFVMPNASSAVLNRVVGGRLSEIYGNLESNGKVFLINPMGLIVGESGCINTASFFASTLDALDADFMKGGDLVFLGDSKNSIVNLGKISAWDGDVALIAYQVDNRGSIEAPFGHAALAAGTNVLLQPAGSERIFIRTTVASEKNEETGIENSGALRSLTAELKADGNPYALAIKDSGQIDALSLREEGGRIFLVADEGRLELSGSYAAVNAEGLGGEVRILGKEITLNEQTKIDVSGQTGGGTVLIGGDYKGSNLEIPNAQYVWVNKGVEIRANAGLGGDGGKVILWGDQVTGFLGKIWAQGGSQSGNGGFVETSSPGYLLAGGRVNTLAPNGKTGIYLMDPCVVTISPNLNMGTPGGPVYTFPGATANIQDTDISGNLMSTNVVIDASATGTAMVGSIRVLDGTNITWNAPMPMGTSLTLRANDNLFSTIVIGDVAISSIVIASLHPMTPISTPVIIIDSPIVQIGDPNQENIVNVTTVSGAIVIQNTNLMIGGNCNLIVNGGGDPMIPGSTESLMQTGGMGAVGGNIDLQLGSGTLTLRGGGNSLDSSKAVIDAEGSFVTLSVAAGDITLSGGDGAGAGAPILGSPGPGAQLMAAGLGSAVNVVSSGDLTIQAVGGMGFSNNDVGIFTGNAANMNLGGNINVTANTIVLSGSNLAGPVANVNSAIASIVACQDGVGIGSVSLTTLVGSVSLFGGGNGTGSPIDGSALIASLAIGGVGINAADGVLLQGGGSIGGISNSAQIKTALGNITITTGTGDVAMRSGSGGSDNSAVITTAFGDITIATRDLTMAQPFFAIESNGHCLISAGTALFGTGNINITCQRNLTMVGGATLNNFVEIQGAGAASIITIQAESVNLFGGGLMMTTGSYARIGTLSGNINIDFLNFPGALTVFASSNPAEIRTLSGGSILIGQDANPMLNPPSGLSLTGGNATLSNAVIATVLGGNIDCAVDGNIAIQGGTSSMDSDAGFYVLGGGNINLNAQQITLTGGGTGVTNKAEIAIFGTGNIGILAGDITLIGGSDLGQTADIATSGTSSNIGIIASNIFLTASTVAGSFITTATGDVSLATFGDIILNADMGTNPNSSAEVLVTTQGTILLNCANHIALAAPGVGMGGAGLSTLSGDITVNCSGSCTYSGGADMVNSLAQMRTFGSDLTVTALGSIILSGFATFQTPEPGHLLLNAGVDVSIGTNSSVIANGMSAGTSSLTIVVDGLFPTSPGIGPGQFILAAGGIVETGGEGIVPLQIFTAVRSQNVINAPINSEVFVPGPEFVDSNTERWGVYYPNSFFGGTPDTFVIFYKNTGVIPPIPPTPGGSPNPLAAIRAAFVDSELFFDLDYYDTFVFYDYYYWSTFNVNLNRDNYHASQTAFSSFDVIGDKGLSIRRRKDFNKIDPVLGIL